MRGDFNTTLIKTALRSAVMQNLTDETLKERLYLVIDNQSTDLQQMIDFIIDIIQEYYMKLVELEHLLSPIIPKEDVNANSTEDESGETETENQTKDQVENQW